VSRNQPAQRTKPDTVRRRSARTALSPPLPEWATASPRATTVVLRHELLNWSSNASGSIRPHRCRTPRNVSRRPCSGANTERRKGGVRRAGAIGLEPATPACARLLNRRRHIRLTYIVFDVLSLEGENLMRAPYSERRAQLAGRQ
jgi:hypothetical protein